MPIKRESIRSRLNRQVYCDAALFGGRCKVGIIVTLVECRSLLPDYKVLTEGRERERDDQTLWNLIDDWYDLLNTKVLYSYKPSRYASKAIECQISFAFRNNKDVVTRTFPLS